MFQRDVQSLETIKVFYHFVDGLLAIPNEVKTELAHRIALENGLDTVVSGDFRQHFFEGNIVVGNGCTDRLFENGRLLGYSRCVGGFDDFLLLFRCVGSGFL